MLWVYTEIHSNRVSETDITVGDEQVNTQSQSPQACKQGLKWPLRTTYSTTLPFG